MKRLLRPFPFFRQRDLMQCGASCLWMICRHFGITAGMERIEELCPPSKLGVSLNTIRIAAETLGLHAEAGRLAVERLGECPLPALLHWRQNHYVVLYRISKNGERYHIADPAKGRYTCNRAEMEENWCYDGRLGIAMLFQPDGDEYASGPERGEGRGVREFFRSWGPSLREYRSLWLQLLAGLLFGTLLDLLLPFLLRDIVDVGINNRSLSLIWLILIGETVIVCGKAAVGFIRRWITLHISLQFNLVMVSDFFSRLLRLPMRFFDTRQIGDLTQRVADHSRIQGFLTTQAPSTLFSLLTFLIMSGVLFYLSPPIFGVYIGLSALYCAWTLLYLHRRRLLDTELFELQSGSQTIVYNLLSSVPEIKLQDCEERKRREWEDMQRRLFALQSKSLRLSQSQESGALFIGEFRNLLVTVMAAASVIEGGNTLGDMMAIQFVAGQLTSPVSQIMGAIYGLQDLVLSVNRISDIRHRAPEDCDEDAPATTDASTTTDTPATTEESGPVAARDIEVRDVTFRYNRYDKAPALENVSLRIPAGSVTAIVGTSGSGKTTLVKLLLGYYTPDSGEIRIGGEDLSGMSKRRWRRQCGCVMQNGVIFGETLRRNIACGDGKPDDERVMAAARTASLSELVERLPMGLDTRIGDTGHGLSQGQKQRVLIARAVYRDPSYIFLDEATNSLDTTTEAEITERLDRFYAGRTVIISAHRLSTVRRADCITVLDKGRIVERGSHEELLALRGHYHRLVRNQLELGE